MANSPFVPQEVLAQWHHKIHTINDPVVNGLPKVELHMHIEGALTAELRWKFSKRNGIPVINHKDNTEFSSMQELKASYLPTGDWGFFEAYYHGLQALHTAEDFYELAMDYFEKAAQMNIRYAEVFFDPQEHTFRGVPFNVFMDAFVKASKHAADNLKVQSTWIMCINRQKSLKSGLEHLEMALPYRDSIAGIGLDAPEHDKPIMLFEELWIRASDLGFKLTSHCDTGHKETIANITSLVGEANRGRGLDRCDHGLSAARSPELVAQIVDKKIGLTLCPWGYIRWDCDEHILGKIRLMYDAGAIVTINSDDPGYMGDCYLIHALLLCRYFGDFSEADLVKFQLNAVDISWANEQVKLALTRDITAYAEAKLDMGAQAPTNGTTPIQSRM